MKDHSMRVTKLPPEQEAIRAKCFHPTGNFVEFPEEDLEIPIPERFEKIVRQYPDRIAVTAESEAVTYAELNAMANRLARLIVNDRGNDAEPVGLFFEKGIPLIAAMLGVLKAGKFFLFLDTSFPMGRITATLDNSQAWLILAGKENFELTKLAAHSGRRLIEFKSIDLGISCENLQLPISPSTLGYIIYTSGSTGMPKGVVKNHQNQLYAVKLRTNANHVCVQDKIALLPSGTANAVANTFLALLNGAELLPFDVNEGGVPSLASWLSEQRVSICQIATPLFRRLCEILTGKEDFSALRILRMRSESVQKSDFLLYQKYFPPSCLFLNGLSTSETSVFTEYLMDQRSVISGNEIPVGYGMEGTEVLLLDDDAKDVGFDQIGEMVVRSKCLSPGYWNNPELTSTKFKPDPHDPEKRLYYTGDLGLMLPDGCLIYKGRKDFRVKIRGYGVELAEIEKALGRHPAIKEAIVLAPRIESREARLVAYFTCYGQPAPSVSELRSYVKEKLPDYMVPSAFVRLDTLPLTSNGKVNRRMLPEPGSSRPELDNPFVAPATLVEEKLATIWAEVLSLDQVGIHDNFFDLGGHSLAATRVVSQVIKKFHLEIPIQYFFQTPTVAGLANYIEKAPPSDYSTSDVSVKSISRDGQLPLSFSQERLWFLDQLEPGGYTYNLLAAYHLKGDLNINALERSINEIIARHEVLRTVFKSVGGQPEQIILPSMAISIPLLDLRGVVSEGERQSEVRRLSREEAQRPFDLARGPLLRISLLRLTDNEYILFRAMHHIIIDGWSGGVLFRELAQFYEAFSNNRPSLHPNLPVQYADFAAWQRQWLQGDVLETHLSYWNKILENSPTLQLPTDRPRPAIQTSHGAHQSFVLSDTVSAQLHNLSQRHGVTLFMTLLAGFQTLLCRYTGQTDIVIGSPVAGRNRGDLESLIGFFLNMLALRIDLSGNPTFRELLTRTREVCLGALAHQDLPFEKLIEEMHAKRDLSRHPLFQVTFGFRNTPRFSIQLAGLKAEEFEVDSEIARFDLNLFMEEESGLRGYVNYNTDLFNIDTIQRLITHFKNLLKSIVTNPGQRISDLSILSETEQHQVLIEWNDTQREYPRTKCIHQLFEKQAEKSPDAVALVFEDQRLTYRELNQRANQLAHYLRKLGVRPEATVGICLERSLEMVVGLLGILKAGGAYVPLDPEYPKERFAFVLDDAQFSLILTQPKLLPQFVDFNVHVLCLDKDWEKIAQENSANPENLVIAENLAYIIYTSGSAGQPKGVQIQHRSVVNLLSSMAQQPGLTDQDTLLAVTTLSFDIAGLELYLPLTVGAQTILVSREVASDGRRLAATLSGSGVTVMQATPTTWGMLLNSGWQDSTHLKALCGGEALPKKLAHRLLCTNSSLWNLYGPTETTIWSAICQVSAKTESISLGRPINNTQTYILDANLQPVPIGVPGEIFIGGDGLARGYLKRPDLTAEMFLPNPFSKQPGTRLYKTGDQARYLLDGSVEFLGRIDDQVKIRGFRIELGEIESVLGQNAGVQEAVALAREDESGDKRLVAYIVPVHGSVPAINEFRRFLAEKLPEYMVPSVFALVDNLPRTPHGKLDRKTLPVPVQSRPELEESFVAPRTVIEEILATIWAEVLKLEKIGVHDNFFELGGHSLSATRVVSQIHAILQVELPLRALFEKPSLAGLAEHIEELQRKEQRLAAPPILPVSRHKDLPLSFAQQRLWFLDQYEPGSTEYNVPGAVRLTGSLDVGALERGINEVIRRHEILRTTFSMINGEPVQVFSASLGVPLTVIDLTVRPQSEREEETRRLAKEEMRRSFDLARGPLFRPILIRLGRKDHVLLLTLHHIVSDGWSMAVLYRELSALYRAFLNSEPSPLPQLSIQYADYAVWQREWFQGEMLDTQLSYWKKQLEGVTGVLNFPTDYPSAAVQSYRETRQSVDVSKELTLGLKGLSRKKDVTLFMTLLAAFQTLLYRYTGQEDIVVGSPVANRNRTEIEGLIGFFVNTLVLRSDFSSNPTFDELLCRVREVALGAYAHQDLPFEKLVEELKPKRALNQTPFFQVLFNMTNQDDSQLELRGLTTERVSFSGSQSKFDLTLYVRELKDEIRFTFAYRAELFSESWMRCFSQQYRYLLEQIVSAPENPIDSYSLVTPEARTLLPDPSAVMAEPQQPLVTSTFLSWAKKAPTQPAIRQGEQSWTYAELAESAAVLAQILRASGVERGDIVAIDGRRSFGLIVSMIGTLLSGAVLLPLDRALPTRRKQLMLQEARAKKLLCVGEKLSEDIKLEEDLAPAILIVDPSKGCVVDAGSGANLHSVALPQVTPDDPAYISFTSGTTGTPHGVLGCHKGLSHFLTWQRVTFDIGPKDRVAQLTSLSFDAALRDIFLPLTSGATLCLPEASDNLGSDEIIGWLNRQQISVLHTVPSLAQSWLATISEKISLPALRYLFFVGEPLTDALVRQCRSTFENTAEIVNLYGPTETTLVRCFYRVPADMRPGVQPIGQPIPDTQALVFGANNQLCGINEAGEIILRTPFRSLGYINALEKNRKRFVKNPFRDDVQDLLYFTGDAGRYAPDGTLEILGRLDDQVKIRGVRVEPAEVTAILAGHPAITSCAVVARKDEQDEMYLIAYAVASEQAKVTTTDLRTYLLQQVPAAMVPSAFVFLDALPLSSNGKIDRNALPAVDRRSPDLEPGYVAPRTVVETSLAEIWAEVLKLDKVGIHDDFFNLGGHSLLATQAISRINKALQVELPLRVLFEKPTLVGLSDHIEVIRCNAKKYQAPSAENADGTEEIIL
jgi:amino acid adenylation domain-containing protein